MSKKKHKKNTAKKAHKNTKTSFAVECDLVEGAEGSWFEDMVKENIKRDGIDVLMNWLEERTDFYTAPASGRYHCACPEGLVMHSLNVYDVLMEKHFDEQEDSRESAATDKLVTNRTRTRRGGSCLEPYNTGRFRPRGLASQLYCRLDPSASLLLMAE